MFLAQTVEGSPFFSTPFGMILAWVLFLMGSVAVIAAGIAGVKSIVRAWVEARDGRAENYRQDKLLDQILSPDGWANGSTNIVEAHKDIYNKVKTVGEKVDRVELAVNDLTKSVEQVITDKRAS